jgi:hypothetical protein
MCCFLTAAVGLKGEEEEGGIIERRGDGRPMQMVLSPLLCGIVLHMIIYYLARPTTASFFASLLILAIFQ